MTAKSADDSRLVRGVRGAWQFLMRRPSPAPVLPHQKIMLIFNPASGSPQRRKRLHKLLRALNAYGHRVTVAETKQAGDATRLGRYAADAGFDCVVSVGGDGTLNEVVQGVAGSQTAVAVFPAGTANVWAAQIRMPHDPRAAAAIITHNYRRPVDLGMAGERYFLLMAGIGFDGEVTNALDPVIKRRFGVLAYIVAGLRLRRWRGTTADLVLDAGDGNKPRRLHVNTMQVIFSNTERYALTRLDRDAVINDGQLEVFVFRGTRLVEGLARLLSVVGGWSYYDRQIERYTVKSARIESSQRVAVQLDGDTVGEVGPTHPVDIVCIPGALQVIVPPGAPDKLFSAEARTIAGAAALK